ncbi:MAG: carboxylating nicotinate-nucleotide diphosphorylase, partial [Rhodocyclaceae bacterium]|nr:carboxylating nicotinate-nucleotide diphosphorylase [Rhodocyclaceae bacterium]
MIPKKYLDSIVRMSLKEDIGKGDVTTEAILKENRKISAYLVAKEDFILAGVPIFERVFKVLSKDFEFNWIKKDGEPVKKGTKFCFIKGRIKEILKGERTALNFIQRLSGISTLTRKFVKRLNDRKIVITDTRKTAPLLRELDKYAVRLGGGKNHRMGLYDGVLIKDNHIKAAGTIKKAIKMAKSKIKKGVIIEVEARSLKEVRDAIDENPDVIMLDNMDVRNIRRAVKIIGGRIKTEVSGGVTLSNI